MNKSGPFQVCMIKILFFGKGGGGTHAEWEIL